MKVKIVDVMENSGMGCVVYNVKKSVFDGNYFSGIVYKVYEDMMKEVEGIEEDFYYVDFIVNGVGGIRFGEDKNVYVISENSEWFGKNCEDGKFLDFVMEYEG